MNRLLWWILIAVNAAVMAVGLTLSMESAVCEPQSVRRLERRKITPDEVWEKFDRVRRGMRRGSFRN